VPYLQGESAAFVDMVQVMGRLALDGLGCNYVSLLELVA
jgi:hypothetical protein